MRKLRIVLEIEAEHEDAVAEQETFQVFVEHAQEHLKEGYQRSRTKARLLSAALEAELVQQMQA